MDEKTRLKQIKCLTIMGIAVLVKKYNKIKNKRKRSCWVRAWIERRSTRNLGSISLIHDELSSEDSFSYKNYLRMNENTFQKLLLLVKPHIEKEDTNMRLSIPARDRLTVTLRFLATGESYQSLMYATRIPACTISKIIPECCEAIYNVLKDKYLKVPNTEDEWNNIADAFLRKWNIPNCLGALDGKHVEFEASKKCGSMYWNYKKSNSIVLLALVDADYKFIYVHAGTNGRVSDGGVFRDSDLSHALQINSLRIPPEKPLPGCATPVPHVIVADAAFPLQKHIMKPFPQRNLTIEQRVFNYRLSRARRVVENGFGILASRFRIFLTRIKLNPDKVETIILASCALHNFLKDENPSYTFEFVDREDNEGNLILGLWRHETAQMQNVTFHDGRPSIPILEIRNEFKNYFNGIGQLPWQNNLI